LRAHDGALDQHIIGAADHEQVLYVVATHDDQLPVPVEIVRVNDAKARLAATAAVAPQTRAEQDAEQQDERDSDNQDRRQRQEPAEDLVVSNEVVEELHTRPLSLHAPATYLYHNRRPTGARRLANG
jgi:hypothetical protein